ncbi:FbpB family small basic protein [Fictibacillus terranigra]|uniref:FbpB family small basic protein n=1 Tax=Fictibacillus terranigra TaxID=3058424 RepID=A0ABT8E537_9BACL|nr:FbpB family small basic protein [Fictibacillus sp. CENA-BCM004]MDN4073026.1 FbpB family small basic protein [Fictibacillus sp. CENA-BCM004]
MSEYYKNSVYNEEKESISVKESVVENKRELLEDKKVLEQIEKRIKSRHQYVHPLVQTK